LPQQTDTDHLKDRIRAYGAGLPERDAAGRFVFSGEGEDHIVKLCQDVGQTRLARRVTYYANDEARLEILVRHGRVLTLRVKCDPTRSLDCLTGTGDEAREALGAIQAALSGCASLTVRYSRLSTDHEPDASGLAPEHILALHMQAKPVPDMSAGHEAGCMAEIHLVAGQIQSAKGSDAGIAQLDRVMSASATGLRNWLEMLNDELIEDIELGLGSGQKVGLDYLGSGVRITLR
jgi:hypothetical protein